MGNGYWSGPYGIRIPNHIASVVAEDGGNTIYQNGGETKMLVLNPLTKKQYLSTYATKEPDGFYYWKGS